MVRHLALAICIALLSGCDVSDPVSPVEKTTTADSFFPIPDNVPPPDSVASWEFRDYPRTKFAARRTLIPVVDLLPVSRFYDTATRYTGVSAPRSGTCTAIPVHGIRYGRDASGAPFDGDTLRLDLWLTTACSVTGGNYNELRLLWDMRSAKMPSYHAATVRIQKGPTVAGGPDSVDTTHRIAFSSSTLEKYRDPSAWCLDNPNIWQLSASPVIEIPTLWTCRDGSIGDTIRLTVTIEPPVLADGYECLPSPSLLVAEVTDTRNNVTARAPFFFLTCSP